VRNSVRYTGKANIIFRARWRKAEMISRVNGTVARGYEGDWPGRSRVDTEER